METTKRSVPHSELDPLNVSEASLSLVEKNTDDASVRYEQLYQHNPELALWIRRQVIAHTDVSNREPIAQIMFMMAAAFDVEHLKSYLSELDTVIKPAA